MNELQTTQGISPLVQAAITGNIDTQKLAELLAIQKEYEANEARKAFHLALAEFKRHPLTIYKEKTVKYATQKGATQYNHATLGAALGEINPVLGSCDLSLTWDTKQGDNGDITVTAILSHSMGHSITTSLAASPDDSGGKNKIQAVGSSVEYLKRYTGFALLGISSKDMDDDGHGAGEQYITEEQVFELEELVAANNLNKDEKWLGKFLGEYLKVDSFENLPATQYKKARTAIEGIISRMKKGGANGADHL